MCGYQALPIAEKKLKCVWSNVCRRSQLLSAILVSVLLFNSACDSNGPLENPSSDTELTQLEEESDLDGISEDDPDTVDVVDDPPAVPLECPETMPEYFPIRPGDTLKYDHFSTIAGGIGSGEDREFGLLTWAISDDAYCYNGVLGIRLNAEFEGIREYRTFTDPEPTWKVRDTLYSQHARTFTFSDQLSIGPYAHSAIPWTYDEASPDTIVVFQYGRNRDGTMLEFVRGRGLVLIAQWNRSGLGSPWTNTTLTLRER